MKTYLISIETLDGSMITPRTGKSKCLATCTELPKERRSLMAFYKDEDCESPGVCVHVNGLERIDQEFKFYSTEKVPFKVTVLKEEENN